MTQLQDWTQRVSQSHIKEMVAPIWHAVIGLGRDDRAKFTRGWVWLMPQLSDIVITCSDVVKEMVLLSQLGFFAEVKREVSYCRL